MSDLIIKDCIIVLLKIGGDSTTSEFMKNLLTKDEKIMVEYKTCQ